MNKETTQIEVRKAVAKDVAVILSLIRELAEYERRPRAVHSTQKTLLRDGFGSKPILKGLLAYIGQVPAGMALYYYYYSTWAGRRGLFLEDLFVRPQFRGGGVGKALMKKLAEIAAAEGCHAIRWEVLEWNKGAIRFYRRLGAKFRNDWKVMQITGPNLKLYRRRIERRRVKHTV